MTMFKKYLSIILSVSLIAGIAPMNAQAKTVEDKEATVQTINKEKAEVAKVESEPIESGTPSESPSVTPKASATPSATPTATPLIPSQGRVVVEEEEAFTVTANSDAKTCTISGYKGNAAVTTLYIPKEVGKKEVTAIAADVFAACPYLKNVVFRADVEIAAGVFPVGTEIWTKTGTKAQAYAQTNGLTFHALDSTESLTGKKDSSFTKGTLTWKAVNEAVSYNIYRKKAKGKYSLYKNVSGLTFTNEKLEAGATYTYKVRPVFTAADGESIEGADSKETAIALTPAKVKKLKAKGIRGGIQVRWARNKNVTGYQVFMKVHVKGFKTSFNRVKTIKKNKVTGYRCKMLVRGMKYSYRVRAFKTIKGKKIAGPFVTVTAKAK
ncbi:MAG: hypothetical protein ACI4SQ_02085 [Eubacterium sp.]